LLTLTLAALAAGNALYWVLLWPASGPTARPAVQVGEAPPIDSDKIALLLGASQAAGDANGPVPVVNLQANFKLLGVIAQGGAGSRGSALIAVQGNPAKPYRVGEVVADTLVLHSVKARAAYLASSTAAPASVTLELPALK
jgi:general secretion pathway protein C